MATPSSSRGKLGESVDGCDRPSPSDEGRFLLSLTLLFDSVVVRLGPALFSPGRWMILSMLVRELVQRVAAGLVLPMTLQLWFIRALQVRNMLLAKRTPIFKLVSLRWVGIELALKPKPHPID